ncbi:kinase-like protein [Metschnikowia bicuspidata var. bicuspidata NRRL YB-4993]|uniref:Kinase-like protein n=1 Tax=Metschnikowia bicuspidata var. bicuspidata NRRL YB-4993 TaxID=869754 RepID=A0A1A0H4Y7_9ASCO|nr:kinase-like protein [Metschnikowia bicuspidata var. bicuspidata NRRL YB-4993]OBA18988.1 kinase-like protein [Metschnikowia bicuspidata var. bicuspidata NRRL YB-4993]
MLTEGTTLIVGTHNVKVVRYLSEGGFSKIYEVIMDPAEGESEIGCLKQVLVPDKNGLNTLRKEVDVMKTLKNARSIVKYFDSNAERLADGSYQVLVLMELCPNKSLLDFMNDRIRQKLSESEILKIMLDISIGVYEMHKIKLIHRDIKIENVLIDAENCFKLCDFGSVSSPIRPAQHPHEFQLLGNDILYHTTPQYRSPEMIDLYRGLPIDERSDIWALGCFLYKLCYYTTPFEANGDIAILHASFQFPLAPVYSGDLKNLIIIMLQENPLYRPNIVQILMLVAKLMGTDYNDLDLEDFYGAKEYNFQALYEMQREKHNQLLKQQQFYLEQQEQQKAYELSKQKKGLSKSTLRVSILRLSRENSAHRKDNETPISSSKPDQTSIPVVDQIAGSIQIKPDVIKDKDVQLIPEQLTSSKELIPNEENLADSSIESVDLDVDLPELDHIAERYPSLEDIHHNFVKSRELSEPSVVGAMNSRTDFELVEAWKQDEKPKRDNQAEKLADEIFANNQNHLTKEFDLSGRYENLHQDVTRPEPKRGSSNPWGKALGSPKPGVTIKKSQDLDAGLQKEMSGLSLASNFEKVKDDLAECDLIDLGDLSSKMNGSVKPEIVVKQEDGEVIGKNPAHKIVENSLIDMGLDGSDGPKPTFRKRLSDIPTQPINFQEQVIDFASDDENQNSEMNRVSIRNSLKKSRKHSDHRRGKTYQSDGKKRLSFFGGSSD